MELSRTGKVWSYTDAQYQPPSPYIVAGDSYEPFALAAVELADEQLVVLGQVAQGYGVDDLEIGISVELVVEPLYELNGVPHVIYRRSEEHTSELQSLMRLSYAVFCLKKKK